MLTRFLAFLPSIFVLTFIVAATSVFLIYFSRKVKPRIAAAVHLTDSGIKRELLFRMPLIFFFSTLSGTAEGCVVLGAVAYALYEVFSSKPVALPMKVVINDMRGRPYKTVMVSKSDAQINVAKLTGFTSYFLLGLASGYYGVLYQSLWICVGLQVGVRLLFLLPFTVIASPILFVLMAITTIINCLILVYAFFVYYLGGYAKEGFAWFVERVQKFLYKHFPPKDPTKLFK